MANVSGITKEETTIIKGKPATLVRRVSNMLKDGNYSGPPLLFRNASMQKLRHCCQNLNLFPYLLYSYDNSKSHPVAKRVNVCIGELVRSLVKRFFYFYKFIRYTTLYNDNNNNKDSNVIAKKISIESKKDKTKELGLEDDERKSITKFQCFQRQRRNQISIFLTIAVYLIPLILALQMAVLYSLLILEKYTPGFIFLVSALMFSAGIAFRIFLHESDKSKKYSRNNSIDIKNNRFIIKAKKIQ
ncbi:uncharacterized protein LOC122526264 [Polistes fuscatus]|uniref:uncharacterized protein LOC122526264 n=1 Tax=Polistes fuscatus TaxID=30207 RepID=UPI001CA7F0FD|nr:uncharacterized protein LOC122526264 [Polistes fuscatus]XP_043505499.1 uncharacterized protein LOC122526264 [Polistes fuscatus]